MKPIKRKEREDQQEEAEGGNNGSSAGYMQLAKSGILLRRNRGVYIFFDRS